MLGRSPDSGQVSTPKWASDEHDAIQRRHTMIRGSFTRRKPSFDAAIADKWACGVQGMTSDAGGWARHRSGSSPPIRQRMLGNVELAHSRG